MVFSYFLKLVLNLLAMLFLDYLLILFRNINNCVVIINLICDLVKRSLIIPYFQDFFLPLHLCVVCYYCSLAVLVVDLA
jgi:hypothetical protein